jgi:energy-coupling factor transporter transmembrane protein EcfT
VWGLAPSLDWLEPVARAAGVALAIAVAFVPRRKTVIQIASLAAAVIVAVQLGAGHWFYFYVAWFLPPFLVAAFALQPRIAGRT